MMDTRIDTGALPEVEADALVAPVFEKDTPRETELLRGLNEASGGWLNEVFETGEFSGKFAEFATLPRPPGLKARRLVLAGLGKLDRFSASELRKLSGAAIRHLKPKSAKSVAIVLDEPHRTEACVAAAVEGAILGGFEPDRYKTEEKEKKEVERFAVCVPGGDPGALTPAHGRARVVAECQNFTRELVNEPANRMTPTLLADRAREMAADSGLECEVIDRDRMRQLGMGALLGVAQGSAEPPALIILRYAPEGGAASGTHVGLVGKGVTFDTGGISIKPSEGMEKMKYDMAGGAAVIGSMRAIARLRPRVPVTGLIPAVENMPGSRAQRPGDIVTSLSGKTVEVLNTDAEGRLILADALTYARRLGCTHLVDAATLTGAIVVALGNVNVGAFSNNEELLNRVLEAAREQGEKMWPMPLDDDYKEVMKSAFADLPNIGNRWGGAITAAMFLKEFAENTPWVHLDIAGTAWLDEAKPFLAKGPSGVGVRTMVALALGWS